MIAAPHRQMVTDNIIIINLPPQARLRTDGYGPTDAAASLRRDNLALSLSPVSKRHRQASKYLGELGSVARLSRHAEALRREARLMWRHRFVVYKQRLLGGWCRGA